MADWWKNLSPESVPYAGYEERMREEARTPAELAIIERRKREQAEADRLAGEQLAKQKIQEALVNRAAAGDPAAIAALAGRLPPVAEIRATPEAVAPYLPGAKVPAPTADTTSGSSPLDLQFEAARRSFQKVPEGDFEKFAAPRRGQAVSPDYLGIPDYELGPGTPERVVTGPLGTVVERQGGLSPRAAGDRARFLDEFVKMKLAEDIAFAKAQQERQAAEIDPREVARAQIATEAAKAEVMGGQAAESEAAAEFTRERAKQLRDPVAAALAEGKADAARVVATEEGRRRAAWDYVNSPDGRAEVEAQFQEDMRTIYKGKKLNPRQKELARAAAQSRVWERQIALYGTLAQEAAYARAGTLMPASTSRTTTPIG